MLTLMERAGDSAINDLWHSVVQLVTNNPQLHVYAARRCAEALRRGASYEVFVKCTGYILGEYGPRLAAAGEVPLLEQFKLLQERFVAASPETKVGRRRGVAISWRAAQLCCNHSQIGGAGAKWLCSQQWHQVCRFAQFYRQFALAATCRRCC